MFIARQHACSTLVRPFPRTTLPVKRQLQLRYATSRALNDKLIPYNELAEQLSDTGLWVNMMGRKKKNAVGDKHRVNIVSQDLCGEFIYWLLQVIPLLIT